MIDYIFPKDQSPDSISPQTEILNSQINILHTK